VSTFFFVYTVVIILVCFSAAVLALSAYVVSHRKRLILQAIFFGAYTFEEISIFYEEWLFQNQPVDPGTYYEIFNPVIRILLGAAVLASLWIMLLRILDVSDKRVRWVPPCVFVVLCAVVVLLMPYGRVRQWCFYTLRQLFILFALSFAVYMWKTSKDEAYRARLYKLRHRLLILAILWACILVEDTFIILIAPIPSHDSEFLLLYLSQRNFSENLMMLYIAYFCVKQSLESLTLRFEAPPVAAQEGDLDNHIEEILPSFASKHKLSPREREVLALVIEGKDNRTIANELILSEGTIKTHVHNITRKCGVTNREELKQAFWSN